MDKLFGAPRVPQEFGDLIGASAEPLPYSDRWNTTQLQLALVQVVMQQRQCAHGCDVYFVCQTQYRWIPAPLA